MQHNFQKKSSNAAILRSGKNTDNDTIIWTETRYKSQPAWSFQFFKDPGCWSVQGLNQCQGSYKKLQPFFNDFSRTTLDFQGPPTRNIISQIVQKCIFPVHSNKTSRLELFASPTSLHSLKLKDFSRLCEPCRVAFSQLS